MTTETDTRIDEGFRSLGVIGDVADVDEKTHHVAIDFPHNVMDGYRTDWGTGCWDASLAKSMPPMVWNHLPHELIGRGVRYEPLGDRTRIINRFSDFDAVPRAKQAFAQIRDGDVPGFSFHYRNGQSIRHPNVRNARRYTRADILETSPVTFPSIPGANAVDIRSQEATLEIPSIQTILQLKTDGIINDDGVRAMLEEHYPNVREHIIIGQAAELTPQQQIDAYLAEHSPDLAESFRAMTITIGDDGNGATTDGNGTVTGDGADDPTTLIQAVDAALDHAVAAVADVDVTTLPDSVQQALALMQAASVAVDELQEVLGISDPDDPLEGDRANTKVSTDPWDFDASKYTPTQLASACLVVDGDGSTKGQCHLPVKEPDGTLNANAVHAAAAALGGARGGTKLSADDQKAAANKLMGLYSTLGETAPAGVLKLAGSGSRSDDISIEVNGPVAEADVDRALETLKRRLPAA